MSAKGNDNCAPRLQSAEPPTVLQRVYQGKALLTASCHFYGGGKAEVEFVFPSYSRTNRPMTHVSAVQITAAIVEGAYCALEDAFLSGRFHKSVTADWFYAAAETNQWIAVEINTTFRKIVAPGESASLSLQLFDFGLKRFRHKRLSMTVGFDGFCSGDTTWVIDPPPEFAD